MCRCMVKILSHSRAMTLKNSFGIQLPIAAIVLNDRTEFKANKYKQESFQEIVLALFEE